MKYWKLIQYFIPSRLWLTWLLIGIFSDIGDTYITIYIYHGGKSKKYSTPRFCLQQYRKCAAIKQAWILTLNTIAGWTIWRQSSAITCQMNMPTCHLYVGFSDNYVNLSDLLSTCHLFPCLKLQYLNVSTPYLCHPVDIVFSDKST